MFVRSGIAADENNIDELRTEVNGWFAEVAQSMLPVPRAIRVDERLVPTTDANISGLTYTSRSTPAYLIAARYVEIDDNGTKTRTFTSGLFTIYQSTITNVGCDIRHIDLTAAPFISNVFGSEFFTCYNEAAGNPSLLLGPIGEERPSGGAPIIIG